MGNWKPLVITSDTLTPRMKAYFKKAGVGVSGDSATADFKARQKVMLQLLNFVVNGSSNERVKPPIRFGVLRASGSAFVDDVLVGDTKSSGHDGTPNTQYTSPKGGGSIGFNTAYAAHLHEDKNWVPGGEPPSAQAQRNPGLVEDVGYKYVEKHLQADREVLLQFYAVMFKKETGA